MLRTTLAAFAIFFVLGSAETSLAQVPSCDDIVFTAQVTSQYADIKNACQEVVEREGRPFVKLQAEVVRVRSASRSVTLRFKDRSGDYGPRVSVTPASPVNVILGGEKVRLRDLARGQEINIYLPPDRWALAHLDETDDAAPVSMTTFEEPEEEDVAAELPRTASSLPWLGLLGLLSLSAGVALGLRRTRVR